MSFGPGQPTAPGGPWSAPEHWVGSRTGPVKCRQSDFPQGLAKAQVRSSWLRPRRMLPLVRIHRIRKSSWNPARAATGRLRPPIAASRSARRLASTDFPKPCPGDLWSAEVLPNASVPSRNPPPIADDVRHLRPASGSCMGCRAPGPPNHTRGGRRGRRHPKPETPRQSRFGG